MAVNPTADQMVDKALDCMEHQSPSTMGEGLLAAFLLLHADLERIAAALERTAPPPEDVDSRGGAI